MRRKGKQKIASFLIFEITADPNENSKKKKKTANLVLHKYALKFKFTCNYQMWI